MSIFGTCACPLPAAITTIPDVTCGLSIKQIQKFIIARRSDQLIATLASAALLASWTPLLAAVDNTKVQVSPFVESVVIPPSEPILEGGDDNTTIDGAPIVVGAGQIRATGLFAELSSAALVALKTYNCESDLMIGFINQDGKIWGSSPDGVKFTLLPITSFFVSDAGNEGLNTRDKSPVGFNLRYGWRDKLVAVVPTDFDARFDL